MKPLLQQKSAFTFPKSLNRLAENKTTEKTDGVFEIKISDVKCTVGTQIKFNDEKSYKMLQNVIKLLDSSI